MLFTGKPSVTCLSLSVKRNGISHDACIVHTKACIKAPHGLKQHLGAKKSNHSPPGHFFLQKTKSANYVAGKSTN